MASIQVARILTVFEPILASWVDSSSRTDAR